MRDAEAWPARNRAHQAHRRRWALAILVLTTPLLSLGTCAEMAVRVSIGSVFDAVDPYLRDAATDAGTTAGDRVREGENP